MRWKLAAPNDRTTCIAIRKTALDRQRPARRDPGFRGGAIEIFSRINQLIVFDPEIVEATEC